MTPILFAMLVRSSQLAQSGFGAILSFIALVVIVIFVLAKLVLGGNHETNSESLTLSGGSDSTSECGVPDTHRIRFHERAVTDATTGIEPKNKCAALVQESTHGGSGDSHDAADQEFEATIAEAIPVEVQEKAFYVKVRGTSHRNSNRTSRTRIIGQCSPFDSLALLPQWEDPEFPNAIRVCRNTTHEQLGYLESRLGEEISRDMQKHGPRWVAFFRRKTQHPESGRTVGAVIRIIKLSEQFIAHSDAVRLSQVK
jgi:hypothetical protein